MFAKTKVLLGDTQTYFQESSEGRKPEYARKILNFFSTFWKWQNLIINNQYHYYYAKSIHEICYVDCFPAIIAEGLLKTVCISVAVPKPAKLFPILKGKKSILSHYIPIYFPILLTRSIRYPATIFKCLHHNICRSWANHSRDELNFQK